MARARYGVNSHARRWFTQFFFHHSPSHHLEEHQVKLRKTLAAAGALAIAGSALAMRPASAVQVGGIEVGVECGLGATTDTCTGGTDAQLTVTTSGSLAISVPDDTAGAVDLGSVAAGAVAASTVNDLGTVTVSDTRTGILNNSWVVAAESTPFVLATAADPANPATNETLSVIGYSAGTVTKNVEPAVGGSTILTPAAADIVAASSVVVTNVAVGANEAEWNPSLLVTVPANNLAGLYEGTITHSAL